MNRLTPFTQRGLTLIELVVTLAVASITVGVVVPNVSQTAERRRVEGTAAQLKTDILHLRSLAVARNQSLRMSFSTQAAGSCYVIHSGPAQACSCDVQGTATCQAGAEALRAVYLPREGQVTVRSNSASVVADAMRGTITPTATVAVEGRGGARLHAVVNVMGRVRTCAASPGLAGYAAC